MNTRDADIDSLANLARYGLAKSIRTRFAQIVANEPDLVPGRVARVDGITTFVHTNSLDYRAASKSARFAHENDLEIEPAQPTVGDWVLVRPGQSHNSGTIELVLPRSSLLVRKRATRGAKIGTDQVLAANIDTVFVVQSTIDFNAGRLERELSLVWASGSTPVVVLTKSDLLEDDGEKPADVLGRATSTAPGVDVFVVSGLTGNATDTLRRFSAAGMTVVLIGASGVGKSTLVNQLMGKEVSDTGEIRESDSRGRHTTTTRQLFPLPGGGVLIDSPGIRTVGLAARSEEALSKTFSEIEPFLGACNFDDCSHEGEAGCAVAEAIADGRLLASRFESYSQMKRELQQDQARSDLRPKSRTGRRGDQED